MARYLDESQAAADGYMITHETEKHRFVIVKDDRRVGEAHYTLFDGPSGAPAIDFDHTHVDHDLRGSGISGLLAHRAVTDDVVSGRHVVASCWFIEGYLKRHPELLEQAGAAEVADSATRPESTE